METSTALLLGGLIGALLVPVAWTAFWLSERAHNRPADEPQPPVSPEVSRVLSVLRSSALVVGPDERVLKASAPAYAMGLVAGAEVGTSELAGQVRAVRRDGQIRESELCYRRHPDEPPVTVVARVAPLGPRLVLVLAEDRTEQRRTEAVRRDFVANVSHELKTPVGAVHVLTEAVEHAAGDPEAVRRFAGRMREESDRLDRLVRQIIELSRVQGDDPLEVSAPVEVDTVVAAAVERVRVDAEAKECQVSVVGDHGHRVRGDPDQLGLAVGNLVENAVSHSHRGGSVTVAVRRVGDRVELGVVDRGPGVPAEERDRIFERFYRVDPARERTTGGTGLGLSIVKHVAAVHGGEVRVWSEEGEGSTFTLALPLMPGREGVEPGAGPATKEAQ